MKSTNKKNLFPEWTAIKFAQLQEGDVVVADFGDETVRALLLASLREPPDWSKEHPILLVRIGHFRADWTVYDSAVGLAAEASAKRWFLSRSIDEAEVFGGVMGQVADSLLVIRPTVIRL